MIFQDTNMNEDKIFKEVKLVTIKGLNGKDGLPGIPGIQGSQGIPGIQGSQGIPGIQGSQGIQGSHGKDGSPDTPEEVVAKVNASTTKVEMASIKDLSATLKNIDTSLKLSPGRISRGGVKLTVQDEGATLSDQVTALDFVGSTVDTTYSNGKAT